MFTIGQRQVSAFVFVGLMILAVVLGRAPEDLLEILSQLAVPLATVGAVFVYLVRAIQKRVTDSDDKFLPGDLVHLATSAEFITAVVVAVISLLPTFGIVVADAHKELLINLALNIVGLLVGVPLIRSYASRPSIGIPENVREEDGEFYGKSHAA